MPVNSALNSGFKPCIFMNSIISVFNFIYYKNQPVMNRSSIICYLQLLTYIYLLRLFPIFLSSADHHGHSGGGKVLNRKSNDHPQPQRRRLLSTDRPFTPRVTDRNLMSRPISAILHKNNVIIEEELEDGFTNSALKLIPLSQYCTTNFKRESLLKRSNSACSSSTSCQTGSSSSKFLPSINNGTNGICSSRSGSSRSQFRYHR